MKPFNIMVFPEKPETSKVVRNENGGSYAGC